MAETLAFQILLGVWLALAAVTFVALFFFTAPYGRHNPTTKGPQIDATLGWVIMEAPSSLVFGALFLLGGRALGPAAWILFALWQIHYLHRAFVFPFRRRGGNRHMALQVMLSAIAFTSINGYLNGRWLGTLGPLYSPDWLTDPRFVVGVVLFASGFAINQHSDRVLFHLRRPGETGYKIPHGGLYRLVSCPNYFGELIEWSGWALATWSLPGLAFAAWTAANLIPRAWAHHKWYRKQFADYPPGRKAIIPLVF